MSLIKKVPFKSRLKRIMDAGRKSTVDSRKLIRCRMLAWLKLSVGKHAEKKVNNLRYTIKQVKEL